MTTGQSSLDELTLRKVNDFVDDDLLSCFLWAAGENAVATPGWESPSVNPLKGIPLPPSMPPLPPAAGEGRGLAAGLPKAAGAAGVASSVVTAGGAMRPPPARPTHLIGGGAAGKASAAKATGGGSGVGTLQPLRPLHKLDEPLPPLEPGGVTAVTDAKLFGTPFGDSPFDEIDDGDDETFGAIKDIDDEDIDKMSQPLHPLSKEQKLSQRMQRKAESARVARLRKKEYVTGLEDQIRDLQQALQQTREANRGHAAVTSSVTSSEAAAAPVTAATSSEPLREEGQRELSHMDALLRQPTLDRLEVNSTVERYVANKRARQHTVEGMLDCIEDILSPAAPLQVAFNPASGATATDAETDEAASAAAALDDADGEGDTDESATAKRQRRESVGSQLMSTLAGELGLSAAQVDGLSAQKHAIREERAIVADCMRQIRLLRARVTAHIDSSQRVTDELRRILEPTQVARFLLWVERHQRSMNLLNSIVAAE